MRIYIAEDGDTLEKIAVKYHVQLEDLIALNPHITSLEVNIPGKQIKLPPSSMLTRNLKDVRPSLEFVHPDIDIPPSSVKTRLDPRGNWIPLTTLEQMSRLEYDVIIVGTGAGGGSVLWRLCEQWGQNGKRIAVVEAGDLVLPTHMWNVPTNAHMKGILSNPIISYPIGNVLPQFSGARQVFALGGRTLWWGTASPRFYDSEFAGWPITLKEMDFYYRIAEQIMNVNRGYAKDSSIQEVLLTRLQDNGFPDATDVSMATDLQPTRFGKIHSNVFFSSTEFLGRALNIRPFDLAVNSRAVEVLTENNKVVGVKVMSPDKKAYFIKAKTIILATSTLETPRILLNSGIQGRAIGHYLTDHSFVRGVGIVNRKDFSEMLGTLNLWIPQTGNRSYGIHIFGPGAFKAYSYREMPLMDTLEIYLHAYGKNESKYENMVSLDPNRKDKYGVPQIQVSFSYSDRDQAVIQQAEAGVKQSSENMGASLKRDGHSETTLLPPGSDNHEAGTCRMGDDPTTSATNRVGQIHGVTGLYVADNSVLPSIGGTNPTLTTIALAIRTADYIIRELS